jgi:serine/threonine protein kinase/Tfp pilus assembly protein PilF
VAKRQRLAAENNQQERAMTPQRWKQIDDVAQAALDRGADERAAFLDQACAGDDVLRREVESHIAHQQQASKFLEEPAFKHAADLITDTQAETESMEGRTISHYSILRKLGAGGMGEVYLADDTNLHRKVAIKFLTAESTADRRANKRLIREAQAAATLDHPNICSIYEVSEEASRSFIVMQYVEGETLADRIRNKPLDLGDCLEIATQVADALAEAHSHCIIHRDIKPQNIMITVRGQAKLMDFGLASLIGQKLSARSEPETPILTDPGSVVGTVPYMSPEQLKGEPLDGRTDIFSFGTVIYQMTTGQQPFAARSDAESVVAILTRDPPPLARYAADVPSELERIVTKALAKNRDKRYHEAADLLIDLQSLKEMLEAKARAAAAIARQQTSEASIDRGSAKTKLKHLLNYLRRRWLAAVGVVAILLLVIIVLMRPPGGIANIDSVAILPYLTPGDNPSLQYLSDGIAEGLIIDLSQLPGLKVISRTSAFRYRPPEVEPREIGRRLKVKAVAIVRVSQIDDRLAVSLELVDAQDGRQIWGAQYDRRLSDIIAVQAEMSQLISERLRLRLTRNEQTQVARRYTDNAEAYQLYLQGRFHYNKLTEEAVNKSIDYFKRSVAKDERFGLAYAALSLAYTTLGANYVPPKQVMEIARAHAIKAIELDSALPEAHVSHANILYAYDWDWAGAESEFKRALDLDANNASAYHGYGYLLETMNRTPESIRMMQRAVALDPLSLIAHMNLGATYYYAAQYDQAIAEYREALELDSSFYYAHLNIADTYALRGMRDEALAELSVVTGVSAENALVRAATARIYASTGKANEAQRILNSLIAASTQKHIPPYEVALIYAALDRRDQALEWFERSVEERSISVLTLGIDPQLNRLHDDQRFKDLLRRINLPR